MRNRVAVILGLTLLVPCLLQAKAPSRVRRGPTAQRPRGHASKRETRAATVTRQGMSPERATELQTALIKAGYLEGSPSGTWDGTSQAAMEKLQSDNGWQTKLVPDSRAIIKLGLGPMSSASPLGATDVDVNTTEAVPAPGLHLTNQ